MKPDQIETAFVAIWCFLMPVTSVLLVPSIQGTVPAYVLGFLSVGLVVLRTDPEGRAKRQKYFFSLAIFFVIWLILLCGSQLGHLFSSRKGFGDMYMVDMDSPEVVFRSSLFTQSIYLFACTCIAMYFRYFFKKEWMRYILWGAWLAALYGIYEWSYFLMFQHSGDFLVNRSFNSGEHTGSWSQAILIGPFSLLRIKSTTGEPAFFALVAIPYLLISTYLRQRLLTIALLFCAILSTSTSMYLGLLFGVLAGLAFTKRLNGATIALLFGLLTAVGVLAIAFPETFGTLFGDKFSGQNQSGQQRWSSFHAFEDQLTQFSMMNWIFGIGFGYSYYSVGLSAFINTGLLGGLIFSAVFLRPIFRLANEGFALQIKVALAVILFIYIINVADFFVPVTWMFLGIAYWLLDLHKTACQMVPPPPRPTS